MKKVALGYQETSLRVGAASGLADRGEQLPLDPLVGKGDLGEWTAEQLVLATSKKDNKS